MREQATPSFWESIPESLSMDTRYEQLSKAASVEEVVAVTRDYLAAWTPGDLERLPDNCRPAWVRNADDIEQWADRLAKESARAMLVLEDERKLDRLTSHFLIASVRIRQLGTGSEPVPNPGKVVSLTP